MTPLFLTSWSKITATGFWKDGQSLVQFEKGSDASEKLKLAYKKLKLSYPKFFKMDGLCKLALLGSEVLISDDLRSKYKDDEIGLLLSNRTSSLQSDTNHCENYLNEAASPAIFVYTLPNIAIGEICIRHKLLGESNFYIFERFAPESLLEQASVLINTTSTKACMVGWLEYHGDAFEAVFYLLEGKGDQKAEPLLLETIKHTQH